MCKCKKKGIITFALATILFILFFEEYYNKHNFFHKKKPIRILSKPTITKSVFTDFIPRKPDNTYNYPKPPNIHAISQLRPQKPSNQKW